MNKLKMNGRKIKIFNENSLNYNISNMRSQNFLTLRKEKISKKNFKSIQDNNSLFLIIDFFSSIPNNFHQQYEQLENKEKINFFIKLLLQSKEAIYISFAVYQIRNILESLSSKNELNCIFSEKHFNIIFIYLSKEYTDNALKENLIFELLKIIEYSARLSPEYLKIICENDSYFNCLINLLSKYNNLIIWSQTLLLIGNLIQIQEWELLQKIHQLIDFYKIINNLIIYHLNELIEYKCLSNVVWNYGLIFKYSPNEILENIFESLKKGIEILCKLSKICLSQSDFKEIITSISYICYKIEYKSYKNIILSTSLIKNLSNMINIDDSLEKVYSILVLFNILHLKNENFIEEFITTDIIENIKIFYEDFLQKNISFSDEFLIEFISFINNCCTNINLRMIICEPNHLLTNLIGYQSNITSNKVLKLLHEFFLNLMKYEKLDRDNIFLEFIRFEHPERLFYQFDNIYNKNELLTNETKELVIIILQEMVNLLIFTDQLFEEKNLIIERYNYLGDFKQMIENLLTKEDENSLLFKLSKEILITYFKP